MTTPAIIAVAKQVESTQQAFEAGATLVHLHVRNDDESPTSNSERFVAVLDGIRQHGPGIVTQVSTGGQRVGRCDAGEGDRLTVAFTAATQVKGRPRTS